MHSRFGCRPPKCLTCPCFLGGQTPCIGIITVLSNLQPFDVEGRQKLTVSAWLEGNSLLRPEIFQNRWRTDKDPTKELASYGAVMRHPLSRSSEAVGESKAVLEQDLETQFSDDIADLNALDPETKQAALRQLKPIMGKVHSIVARFVKDAQILKTSQGRGAGRSDASVIAKKTKPNPNYGIEKQKPKPMFPVTGAAASPMACAKGYGAGAPKSGRSKPGNNHHIAEDEKWTCPVCKVKVKNCSDSIKQHKGTASCRQLTARMHHCEACNIYCENTPDAIREHNESYDHGHQRRLDADVQRDGSELAENRRSENDGRVQNAKKTKTK